MVVTFKIIPPMGDLDLSELELLHAAQSSLKVIGPRHPNAGTCQATETVHLGPQNSPPMHEPNDSLSQSQAPHSASLTFEPPCPGSNWAPSAEM